MTFELPLFPLNVVLFPGMQLPLHIFEPRYKMMVERCLEADRTFGVTLIVEGQEGSPGTRPAGVGCIAEITEAVPFPDGRMNLQTIGRRRFSVLSTRELDDYIVGTVEWLDDEMSEDRTRELAAQVRNCLRRYLAAFTNDAKLADSAVDELDVPTDPLALSMWVATLLTIANGQKQELLELDSTSRRLAQELFALLQRAELIQRAFGRRAQWLADNPQTDEATGAFAQFISPN